MSGSGEVYVQMFDAALASWYGENPAMCIFGEKCGKALAMEHNGDLYSCDHFVEPKYLLGNIMENNMVDLISSEKQMNFGNDKLDTLPKYCLECKVRFACHGECPKNRFIETPDGEPGLNYLCEGYKAFFMHVDMPMKFMAQKLRMNQAPSAIVQFYREEDKRIRELFAGAERNDLCPCGSGKKFKHCHGKSFAE